MTKLNEDYVSRNDIYGDTLHTEERCFIVDFTSPDHCANDGSRCTDDVLNFGHRIRRDLNITITFDGWFDPEPDSVVGVASGM